MKVYIAADHRGFHLKKFLLESGVPIEDLGAYELIPDDDYPDYVIPLVRKVAGNSENRGIVLCQNGVGVSIAANKIKGVRCSLSWNAKHAASSRSDDNTNVLALPAGYIDEETALEIVKAWLGTEFSQEDRHKRRLQKVDEI